MRQIISVFLCIIIFFSCTGCNISTSLKSENTLEKTDSITSFESIGSIESIESSESPSESDFVNEDVVEVLTAANGRPYDEHGILYEDELKYYLGEFGSIYWDATKEYYVLKPRDTYRTVILGLVENPFNETYLEYWDLVVEMIQLVTEEFPAAVCVSNPANPQSFLLIVVMGDVGYTAF